MPIGNDAHPELHGAGEISAGNVDQPRRTTRRIVIGAGTAGLLLAGGVGVSAALAAAGPTPEQVVRSFVEATFAEPGGDAAAPMTCDRHDVVNLRLWSRDIAQRRIQYHLPPLQVGVTSYQQQDAGAKVIADVDIAVTLVEAGRPVERLTRPHRFTLTDDHGWKVCSVVATG